MRIGNRRILIIGAGIGGSAAALALRRAGLEAELYEARSRKGTQYGGCYVLWYAGVLSLARLGLAEKAYACGHQLARLEMCDTRGRVFNSVDMETRGRSLGAVPIAIRRADLLNILYDELGPDGLALNSTFRGMSEDSRGVTATFTDGRTERGAILVGADGLDSRVRAHLHGLEPARYPGYAHWSGIAETDAGAPARLFRILHGNGARFAFFHLGGGRVCWWCVRNAAMTFNLGQGAGTSLTDAVTLADHLAGSIGAISAIRAYERARRSVTLPLMVASRRVGESASWGGLLGPALNAAVLRRIGPKVTGPLLELDARSHAGLSH